MKEEGSSGSWAGFPRARRRGHLSGEESEGLGMKLRERGKRARCRQAEEGWGACRVDQGWKRR